jgi:hypothetical protein
MVFGWRCGSVMRGAMVRVVGDWLANFWSQWCRDAAGVVVGRIDFVAEVMVVVVENVILWQRWWRLMRRDVVVWRRWRVDIDRMLHLIERGLLLLFLLAKDIDDVL